MVSLLSSDGSGYGDGTGSGYGYGSGYGIGSGSGSGYHGYGSGSGSGSGSGYGSGSGGRKWTREFVAGHMVYVVNAQFGVLSVGCELGTVGWWRRHWREVAARHEVEVDEREVARVLQVIEELLE